MPSKTRPSPFYSLELARDQILHVVSSPPKPSLTSTYFHDLNSFIMSPFSLKSSMKPPYLSPTFIPPTPFRSLFCPISHPLSTFSRISRSLPFCSIKHPRASHRPFNCSTPPQNTSSDTHSPAQTFSASSFRTIRKILTALSILGCLETSYLTFNKFFSSPGAICATQGCLDVLSGPFSSFLGIPLTLFGTLTYGVFAYLCAWPLAADEQEDQNGLLLSVQRVYHARDAATRPLLLALSTALLVFSGFLMSLLVFVIQSMCPYCVFSAVLSAVIFALTAIVGRAVPKFREALRVGVTSAAVTSLLAAVFFFISYPVHISAQPPGELQAPPSITMKSTPDTLVRSVLTKPY